MFVWQGRVIWSTGQVVISVSMWCEAWNLGLCGAFSCRYHVFDAGGLAKTHSKSTLMTKFVPRSLLVPWFGFGALTGYFVVRDGF